MNEETKGSDATKAESKGSKAPKDSKQTELATPSGADAPMAEMPKPAPAKALMPLTMGKKDGDNTVRWVIEKGDTIPEDQLAGSDFVEGKHYMRGEAPKPGPKKINGKDHRLAKITILGTKAGERGPERHEFAAGEWIPEDQLGGLKEGVHFE